MKPTAATSPFEKTQLLPIEEGFSKKGVLMGLLLPNGKILLNYEHGTKNSTMAEIARVLNATQIVVQGTWTFTPDLLDEEDEPDE